MRCQIQIPLSVSPNWPLFFCFKFCSLHERKIISSFLFVVYVSWEDCYCLLTAADEFCAETSIISWQQSIHGRLIDRDMRDLFYVLLRSAFLLYCYLRWSQRPLKWDWWLGTPLMSCFCSHSQTNGISQQGYYRQVLWCISLMHDTWPNSWLATVKLFCFALFL